MQPAASQGVADSTAAAVVIDVPQDLRYRLPARLTWHVREAVSVKAGQPLARLISLPDSPSPAIPAAPSADKGAEKSECLDPVTAPPRPSRAAATSWLQGLIPSGPPTVDRSSKADSAVEPAGGVSTLAAASPAPPNASIPLNERQTQRAREAGAGVLLHSPTDGVVEQLLVPSGFVVEAFNERLALIRRPTEVCRHPLVLHGLCVDCHEPVDADAPTAAGTAIGASSPTQGGRRMVQPGFISNQPGFHLAHDVAVDMQKEKTSNLLRANKLILVLDLDNTLLHASGAQPPPSACPVLPLPLGKPPDPLAPAAATPELQNKEQHLRQQFKRNHANHSSMQILFPSWAINRKPLLPPLLPLPLWIDSVGSYVVATSCSSELHRK
eukprot:GHVT01006526.1.p1 GENE.GHVT01006526.1~~GHVT01006526.1.p1  ORF type:complete len:383 (-),score=58.76 GHVT01006526.1:51-1199(-)